MYRNLFYATLRKRDSNLFGTSLSQGQVDGIEGILDEAILRRTQLKHLAYMLATAYHETGRKMQPVSENLNYSVNGLLKTFGRHRISVAEARKYGRSGSRKANQRAIANIIYGGDWGRENLGNTKPGDGWKYRGRGLPQITGRANYRKFGMESNPERASELLPSVRMMFEGMTRGLYTGKKLSDFTTYRQMRRVVNAMDKANKIAGHAIAFEKALKAGRYGEMSPTAMNDAIRKEMASRAKLPADIIAPKPPQKPVQRDPVQPTPIDQTPTPGESPARSGGLVAAIKAFFSLFRRKG